jgi:hypothetical protein
LWEEGEAVTKEIIAQFNAFLNGFMSHSFNSYYEDKEWKPGAEAVTPFQEVLQKIITLDCQIEIIGYWIYCFNSKEVKEQLKELGFWFSGKHKAQVYSGAAQTVTGGKRNPGRNQYQERQSENRKRGTGRKNKVPA